MEENKPLEGESQDSQATDTNVAAETVEKTHYEQRNFATIDDWAADYDAKDAELRSYKERDAETLEANIKSKEYYEIWKGSENPYASEMIATVNAIAKKTGIDDLGAISKIVSLSPESSATNPLDSLVLNMRIKNPSLYNQLGGEEGTREMFMEKFNISDLDEYTPTKLMIAEAYTANEEIQKLKEEVKNSQNTFTFAQSKLREENEKFAGIQQTVVAQVNEIASTLTEIVEEMDGVKISLNVTKSEIDQVISQAPNLAQYFLNVPSKDVPQSVRTVVMAMLKDAKFKSGEIYKEWKEAHYANIKQQVTQEMYGGSPVKPTRTSTPAPVSGKTNPILDAARAEGKQIPESLMQYLSKQ